MSAARALASGDLGILVESVERTHLVWLEEFLGPWFETRAAGAHDCRVCLVEDRERYAEAMAAGSAGGTLDAFALDTTAGALLFPRAARRARLGAPMHGADGRADATGPREVRRGGRGGQTRTHAGEIRATCGVGPATHIRTG